MSYPKRKDRFVQWSKAMVEGATIDKPSYPGTRNPGKSQQGVKPRKSQQRRRRRKKKRNSDG